VADVRRAEAGRPLPVDDAAFDIAWASEVIEHVVDVGAFASELRRVTRPGGTILVTTPDHGLRTRLALVGPRRFDDHFNPHADHLRFFTRRTLRDVLGGADVTSSGGRLYAVARA
jgi:SAM-dependent methyltransferase